MEPTNSNYSTTPIKPIRVGGETRDQLIARMHELGASLARLSLNMKRPTDDNTALGYFEDAFNTGAFMAFDYMMRWYPIGRDADGFATEESQTQMVEADAILLFNSKTELVEYVESGAEYNMSWRDDVERDPGYTHWARTITNPKTPIRNF